jgi:hypothetical protein
MDQTGRSHPLAQAGAVSSEAARFAEFDNARHRQLRSYHDQYRFE